MTAAAVLAALEARGLHLAVAESLTGGLLAAEFVAVPGASRVFLGGVVAYHTGLKHSVLGVDASIINVHGAVHPDVAIQMAVRVREVLAVDGLPAQVGVATTGVAGPDPQDGHPAGTVFIAVAIGGDARVVELALRGDRNEIRRQVVVAAIGELAQRLDGLE